MSDISPFGDRLQQMLAELEVRQKRISGELEEPLDADSSERAIELEDDVSLEGQAALISQEIASVKRALARIDDGTYGQCVRCGEDIAPARLEARPEAALCISCARGAEYARSGHSLMARNEAGAHPCCLFLPGDGT